MAIKVDPGPQVVQDLVRFLGFSNSQLSDTIEKFTIGLGEYVYIDSSTSRIRALYRSSTINNPFIRYQMTLAISRPMLHKSGLTSVLGFSPLTVKLRASTNTEFRKQSSRFRWV